ncbi:hypothetical protein Tco_1414415, partial [Tanacetum coccineum]
LPPDVYVIVNHHKVAKETWDIVKLLMQGTKLSLQERECKLYDEFDKFSFVKAVAASRFPSTKNQLRTSSNPRNQATIQDDKEGRQGLLNAIIVKVKDTWLGNALSLRGQGTLYDPGIPDGQAAQTTIPNNVAFQSEDLDAFDYDCDDVFTA